MYYSFQRIYLRVLTCGVLQGLLAAPRHLPICSFVCLNIPLEYSILQMISIKCRQVILEMLERDNDLMSCSLSYTFRAIGGKWKPYIIWYLNLAPDEGYRYGELKRKIPWTISHKMFSQQLQELKEDGIIDRIEYDKKPARVQYALTKAGRLLIPIMLYLRDWGAEFGDSFGSQVIERSMGDWNGTIITYQYADEELGKSVEVKFNIGRVREDGKLDLYEREV